MTDESIEELRRILELGLNKEASFRIRNVIATETGTNVDVDVSDWLMEITEPLIESGSNEIPPLPQPLVDLEDRVYWNHFVKVQSEK